MVRTFLLLMTLATAPAWASSPFLQGPERIGQELTAAGKVIGVHAGPASTCYVVLADRPDPAAQGLGGGGRFFLCATHKPLAMGDAWKGAVRQTATRRAKVGAHWRTLPVFEPSR